MRCHVSHLGELRSEDANQLLQFQPSLSEPVLFVDGLGSIGGSTQGLIIVADVAEKQIDRFRPSDHVKLVLSA